MLSATLEEETLDFGARPRRASKEFETRRHARVELKAADLHASAQLLPTELVDERRHDLLEGDAVQRIVGVLHALTLLPSPSSCSRDSA